MAQLPLSRMSQSGTYAKSQQPPLRMAFLIPCSLAPANHQLVWYPTLMDHALIALPVPSLAPESTYRAKTLALQSRRTYRTRTHRTRTHRTRSKGGKGKGKGKVRDRDNRDRDRDRDRYRDRDRGGDRDSQIKRIMSKLQF